MIANVQYQKDKRLFLDEKRLKSAPQKFFNLKIFNANNFNEVTLVTRNVAIVSIC